MWTTWKTMSRDFDQFIGQVNRAIKDYGRTKVMIASVVILEFANPIDTLVLANACYRPVAALVGIRPV